MPTFLTACRIKGLVYLTAYRLPFATKVLKPYLGPGPYIGSGPHIGPGPEESIYEESIYEESIYEESVYE